jgi:hypothetical protein
MTKENKITKIRKNTWKVSRPGTDKKKSGEVVVIAESENETAKRILRDWGIL